MRQSRTANDGIVCGCTAISAGCGWTGRADEMVVVEFMPVYLRASHAAARNCGRFPLNGAIRFRAEQSCAEELIETANGWACEVQL